MDPRSGTDSPDGAVARGRPAAAELVHALGQAVIATDPEGVITCWNPAAERLYGWRAEEVLGRNISGVTVPQVSLEAAEEIMAALRDGHAWSGGFPVQRRDGTTLHALVTDSGIYRDGVLIGMVGVSLDLGDAVQHLMERSSDAALLLDDHRVVEYASPAVTRLFGWAVDEVVGAPLANLLHPEDLDAWEDLVATDAPGQDRIGELRVRADDDWTWVEVAVADLYNDPQRATTVCHLRRSERLARLEERERLFEAMHAEVLQDLFAAALAVEHLLTRATPSAQPRLELTRDAIGRAIDVLRDAVRP